MSRNCRAPLELQELRRRVCSTRHRNWRPVGSRAAAKSKRRGEVRNGFLPSHPPVGREQRRYLQNTQKRTQASLF